MILETVWKTPSKSNAFTNRVSNQEAALDRKGKDFGRSFDAWEKAAYDIVEQTRRSSEQGEKEYISRRKDKPLGFESDEALRLYILELHASQQGICNLTGLAYSDRMKENRGDMMMSLDRINSDLGYIRGNLQLTCWFANRWKGSGGNSKFLELIDKVRKHQPNSSEFEIKV